MTIPTMMTAEEVTAELELDSIEQEQPKEQPLSKAAAVRILIKEDQSRTNAAIIEQAQTRYGVEVTRQYVDTLRHDLRKSGSIAAAPVARSSYRSTEPTSDELLTIASSLTAKKLQTSLKADPVALLLKAHNGDLAALRQAIAEHVSADPVCKLLVAVKGDEDKAAKLIAFAERQAAKLKEEEEIIAKAQALIESRKQRSAEVSAILG